MEIEDSQFEIFVVSIAGGVALQRSDFGVDGLQRCRADAVLMPGAAHERPCRGGAAISEV